MFSLLNSTARKHAVASCFSHHQIAGLSVRILIGDPPWRIDAGPAERAHDLGCARVSQPDTEYGPDRLDAGRAVVLRSNYVMLTTFCRSRLF